MTGTVLIVDDSLTVRMDLAEAFEAAGLHPLPCATAAEAREAIEKKNVSLAVLDVLLPDGDGVELLKQIRAKPDGNATPVLMLSSEADVRDRILGLRTGADDYVGKPYDIDYVIGRARELMRRHQTPAEVKHETNTILVIDDSETFREALRRALMAAGYEVLTAPGGEEGLRIAASRSPAAVIVDGIMPGLDGAGVIRRMRLDGALRGTPCVLLTALEEREAEVAALDAGADAFVRKDEELPVILARLGAVLRSARAQREESATLLSPKRILAVDDSVTYLHELADMLRGEGYDVVLARSGSDAIDLLAVQTVDCILLDLIMPGLSGDETCRRIKTSPTLRDVPLLILTSVEDRQAMIQCLTSGADDFISKTHDFDVLKARVRAQIRRKQFEDEHRQVHERLLRQELEAAEARAARDVAEARAAMVEELERKNKELEAFSYSVSHDLRAPLRSIDGFSKILLSDYASTLDDRGQNLLGRVCGAAERMNELIEDMLELSRVSRAELRRQRVVISDIARVVCDELARKEPERVVTCLMGETPAVDADARLVRVLLENLLGNAWKFTSRVPEARVELGVERGADTPVFFVRDNGAGFNMDYAGKLFGPFQRLHADSDFPGTGIGLATVARIVDRHGGRIWAEGAVGKGATFRFTLPPARYR